MTFISVGIGGSIAYCSSLTRKEARDAVHSAIRKHDVIIFSATYCGYCTRAKRALQLRQIPFGVVELDVVENGDEMAAVLHEETGQTSVPNIFVKGRHLGGCDSLLAAIDNGKFADMLTSERKG